MRLHCLGSQKLLLMCAALEGERPLSVRRKRRRKTAERAGRETAVLLGAITMLV